MAATRTTSEPLRRADLGPCIVCGRGIMHDGNIVFYRVTIERFGADLAAIKRAHGLELMVGSPVIANILGPDEPLAVPVMPKLTVILCETCSTTTSAIVPLLADRACIEPPTIPAREAGIS